tara:strand:- start:2591 stop:2989 length:399 start_codon:yes stop_codon:yes gene_type:complete
MLKIKRTEEKLKLSNEKKEHFWNKYENPEVTEFDISQEEKTKDERLSGSLRSERSIARNMWQDLNVKNNVNEILEGTFGQEWNIDILWQKIQVVFWIVGAYFMIRFGWFLLAFLMKPLKLEGPKNLLKPERD